MRSNVAEFTMAAPWFSTNPTATFLAKVVLMTTSVPLFLMVPLPEKTAVLSVKTLLVTVSVPSLRIPLGPSPGVVVDRGAGDDHGACAAVLRPPAHVARKYSQSHFW